MKEKILTKLVAKYPGLSKAFLGHLADQLAKGVTEEDKIEDTLTTLDTLPIKVEDLAAEFQKEGDRRVSTAKKEWEKKTKPAADKTEEATNPKEDDLPADTPAWAKSLAASNKALAEKLGKLEAEKSQQSIFSQAKEKLKDVPEVFWSKRRLPEKAEEIEAFVSEVTTDYGDFTKTNPPATGLAANSILPKTGVAVPPGGQVKEATKEELEALTNLI